MSVLGTVLVFHRYLAVAVGVLMTLWCLSGFVMMYQGYPRLTEDERRAGLAPLDFMECCAATELPFADDAQAPDQLRIEMLLGKPVLRVAGGFGGSSSAAGTFDLATGSRVPELATHEVWMVASDFGRRRALGVARFVEPVEIDQWTVQTARRYRPIYRVGFGDAAGTEIYVSGASGEVFQDTTRRERVFNWFGAIPHWLYPTQLRRNGPVWSEVVIWTSLLGTFLTVTGLYVGIARLRRRRGRLGSPFRGLWYWHHISGLIFGAFTLTWVFSGLLTMNPWGTLVGTGAFDHIGTIKGAAAWRDVKQLVANASTTLADDRLVQISSAVFDGHFHALAFDADGGRVRLDRTGLPSSLQPEDIDGAVARLGISVAEARLLEEEDSYYYRHKNETELPVYRVTLGDAERTLLYVNPATGGIRGVDATGRASRWLRVGLHDLDFAGLRIRPIWDLVVGLLLLGVTATCAIGTWLAVKRLRRDFLWLKRLFAPRPVDSPTA